MSNTLFSSQKHLKVFLRVETLLKITTKRALSLCLTHYIFLSLFTIIPSKQERNNSALPTSQSLRGLEKDRLQPPSQGIEKSQTSSTHASLEHVKENKDKKKSHNKSIPHHLPFQNLTLCPLPTSKEILLLTSPHSFLIAFQTPTPNPSLTSLEHHPLLLPHTSHW